MALRNGEPAPGSTLFVPGGCVLKNEPIEAAFERIVQREIGRRIGYGTARFRGVFQHFHHGNRFGSDGSGTHYVVLAHDVALPADATVTLDRSHATYRWLTESEILASVEVHEYVKDYFRPARRTHHAAM